MCGIVGYIGHSNPIEVVLEGLSRLEYRGYDSAGVSFLNPENEIITYKKAGELGFLKAELPKVAPECSVAIGHTRWATHGVVNDHNAHPHESLEWSCVHNGIIENFTELKEELSSMGAKYSSDTDTEVFVRLLENFSLSEAFMKIKGNSAFVLMDKKTGSIYAIKKSAPLVLGRTKDKSDFMVSSDPYALVGKVDELIFPEDDVLCIINKTEGISFYELDGTESTRVMLKKQDANFKVSSKGNYEHFMLKEIFEQPELIRDIYSFYKSGEGLSNLKKLKSSYPFNNVHITACGTAYYAGLVIRNFLEKFNKTQTNCDLASEFRYRNPILNEKDLAFFISQSGETADTLAAMDICKKSNVKTASILNVAGSTLYREVDYNFLIHAGAEIGVASTKAFTQMCVVGRVITSFLESDIAFIKMEEKLGLLSRRISEILNKADEIKKIAEALYNYKGYFFTGRGIYYPVALEGALKLKEIAYVHAEGYAAGELKHGPLALIDQEMVNIAIVGPELYDKAFSNLKEIKTRKGIILSIGQVGDQKLINESDYFIGLDFDGLDELSPIYVNVVNQLLSYYMAKFKGHDIDKPRNLAKSVTVE